MSKGVADPGPIISSLWVDDSLESCLQLDGVITVVDLKNVMTYLNDPGIMSDVMMQIGYADRILMNKIDLVAEEEVHYILIYGPYFQWEVINVCFVLDKCN